MKSFLPILLILTLIAAGCYSIETVESTTVSSNDVYQSYSIKTAKNRTSVYVVFRVGTESGATIDLDAPSKIEYNGALLPEIAPTGWKGTTYEESTNKFIGNHQFIYTDSNGKTFRNEINFVPLEFSGSSFRVNRQSNTLIPLSRSVSGDEEISAYIFGKAKPGKTNSTAESSNSIPVRLNSARSAILIEPNDLQNFLNGKAILSLRAEKTESLKQNGAKGGEIRLSYEAQEATLDIAK